MRPLLALLPALLLSGLVPAAQAQTYCNLPASAPNVDEVCEASVQTIVESPGDTVDGLLCLVFPFPPSPSASCLSAVPEPLRSELREFVFCFYQTAPENWTRDCK